MNVWICDMCDEPGDVYVGWSVPDDVFTFCPDCYAEEIDCMAERQAEATEDEA
jgi:hypothetical protein